MRRELKEYTESAQIIAGVGATTIDSTYLKLLFEYNRNNIQRTGVDEYCLDFTPMTTQRIPRLRTADLPKST